MLGIFIDLIVSYGIVRVGAKCRFDPVQILVLDKIANSPRVVSFSSSPVSAIV
jgi:hypothetical protein